MSQSEVSSYVAGLGQFRVAPRKQARSQEEKVAVLCGLVLEALFRAGACPIDGLEAAVIERGFTGRVRVTLGAGIGGRGGLNAFCAGAQVVLCKDNVLNCVTRLGPERFQQWLQAAGVSLADFQAWLQRQQSI